MSKKLPARALFYAIMVSIFVGLISAAMLLSSYHQHLLVNYYQNQERLVDNCSSAIELILGGKEILVPKTPIDLFGEKKDSVSIEQKPWGLFDVVAVNAWSGQGYRKDSIKKAFFIGKQPPNYALRLSEGTDPLYVCGNTRIVGDAFLPREGIERGFIQGNPYQGQKLVFGKQKLIKRIDNKFLKARFEELNALKNASANFVLESDSLVNSFEQNTLVLAGGSFNMANLYLKGNIMVVAEQEIRVSAAALLEDVLLIAPKILIEEGFQGNMQAFAWDSLLVEPNVILTYPSVLSLLPYEKKRNFSPELTISGNSEITGVVIAPNYIYNNYKTKVHLHPNSKVNGQVWVDGLLQHKGIVHGAVSCSEFLLQTPSAVYENYVLDAIIDRTLLPNAYLAPIILGKDSNKGILKYAE